MAVETIKNGDSVILDGTFYKEKLRQKVESSAREMHLIPHFTEVKADEEVIRNRIGSQGAKYSGPLCETHARCH